METSEEPHSIHKTWAGRTHGWKMPALLELELLLDMLAGMGAGLSQHWQLLAATGPQ